MIEIDELYEHNKLNEFKAGDLVYCPTVSTNILRVYQFQEDTTHLYIIRDLDGDAKAAITQHGQLYNAHHAPSVFHATPENKEKLESLYGKQFEVPKRILNGSELCKYLLKSKPHVLCFVSDANDNSARIGRTVEVITSFNEEYKFFVNLTDFGWNFAVPIDLETLEPLEPLEVDEVEDE